MPTFVLHEQRFWQTTNEDDDGNKETIGFVRNVFSRVNFELHENFGSVNFLADFMSAPIQRKDRIAFQKSHKIHLTAHLLAIQVLS